MIKILFVCMGNICRSPSAEGVFRKLAEEEGISNRLAIDSAGTHAHHLKEKPDPRAQKAAKKRGMDISQLEARRLNANDFEIFDHILAMDESNYADLKELCPAIYRYKIRLFMDYAPHLNTTEVPDPYYGGVHNFEQVLDLVEDASIGLMETLRSQGL